MNLEPKTFFQKGPKHQRHKLSIRRLWERRNNLVVLCLDPLGSYNLLPLRLPCLHQERLEAHLWETYQP